MDLLSALREFFTAFPSLASTWFDAKTAAAHLTPEEKKSSVELSGTVNGIKVTIKHYEVSAHEAMTVALAELDRARGVSGIDKQ